MPLEIERKFLVDVDKLGTLENGTRITQGYIQTTDKTAVRVRIKGTSAYLTIKGKNIGATRTEYEYAIPLLDAQEMIDTLCCASPLIDKVRYERIVDGRTWEIDVFGGENAGLIIAEVELESEDAPFSLPIWAKDEVTLDARYYNSSLITYPFCEWKGI